MQYRINHGCTYSQKGLTRLWDKKSSAIVSADLIGNFIPSQGITSLVGRIKLLVMRLEDTME